MTKKPSFFDQIIPRRDTDSVKWNIYPEDVLPLWVADMDFRSPHAVLEALTDRVAHGVFGYIKDQVELKQVIVARLQSLYHWQVKEEDIILLPGVIVGFNLAAQAFSRPGEAFLLQTPAYPPFFHVAENAGLTCRQLELVRGEVDNYEIDCDAFEASIDEKVRLFILCNPHNPVGRVFSRQELTKMAEICLRHKIILCSDEIHSDFIYPGHQHIPAASINEEIAMNTITLMAPSKTFNIAGLKCSFAVIQNKVLREKFMAAKKGTVPNVNLLGATAALAAYRHGQEWLDSLIDYLDENRHFLVAYVRQEMPKIKITDPEGTYLAWLDCRALLPRHDPYAFFLEHARVALNNGKEFGIGGEGFVRLNFGCPRQTLEKALFQMKEAYDTLDT